MQPNHNEQSGKSLLNQCFGQGNYSYTVETVLTTADLNQIALPLKYTLPPQVETAADLLAGYLVFDYWIDNIDRHYENWGIQIDTTTGRKELLPTYDHGLGLGYLLFEEEYLDLDPANHVQNQSSAFSGSKGRSLSMSGMLATVVSIKPNAVRVWMERITQIDSQIVTQLFDRIPEGWISEPAKNFAIELLEFNRQQIASICELALPELPEMENPPDSPEPPAAPVRNPPRPTTPPNSPAPSNSPDSPPLDDSPPIATNTNKSPGTTTMSIKLIKYDLINRRPQTKLTTSEIETELREGTALEQLMRQQGLLKEGEQPTFYTAPYSKYINVDDLTNHAPEGTVLLATSSAQLYFGSPEVKAAIKTLMPLETQIPGYARGLFTKGQSQSLDRPLKVLVVDHETGQNNSGIPKLAIRNIAADGASIIDRSVGERMKLIEDVGLSQVRGYSLDPQIGSYYIKGTVTPLNLQKYFATHGVDVDVDLVLTTSMLKGLGGGKLPPQIGMHQVDSQDLFISRTETFHQTTAKLGSVQELYAVGLAKDVAIPVQTAIGDLQQKQMDLISLAEDYVRTFKISQQEDLKKGKPEVELPGNIAFIDTILESKNWGLLELASVRANLQEYVDGQIKDIKEGSINQLRGEFRPIVVCGELKHNQIAGVGLTTGDKHVALRFPVLNRGQVQAVTVNNDISFFLNPELEGVIPDAIYVGRQTLAQIEQDDPQTYQQIIEEFGSVEAAQASWRTNLEAMKADFDGDEIALFAQKTYPNFYAEVVDNLTPEKLMHFVSKDKKQLIQSEDLPGMVVERLKDYVGIINSNLGKINKLYSSIDFIIASTDGELSAPARQSAQKLKLETLQLIYESFQTYKVDAESVVEPGVSLSLRVPDDLQAAFEQFPPFYSVDFIKEQTENPRAQANYLWAIRKPMERLLGAYKAKTLDATAVDLKQGIVFSADLLDRIERVKYMKLGDIAKGKADLSLLVDYLENYAIVYDRVSQIVNLSQPVTANIATFDPDTNQPMTIVEQIKVVPNLPYYPAQLDTYLRHYQTVILRKAIEVVDKENQRSVDFVKSGVKPDEGTVYAVTSKLPEIDMGIQSIKRFIIEQNHENRLPPTSSMTLNALIGSLRSVPVQPEIKAMVANYRDDYQNLQSTIALEKQALDEFKHGKPIVLNIYTNDGSKVVVSDCNVTEVNTFRRLEGRGSIDIDDRLVTFHPDDSATLKGVNYQYTIGSISKTSAQIQGKQNVSDFEFEVLHDRLDELKAESREILADFRATIDKRGWDRREVFAATAQLVGEKAISQDFLLSALPQTLNEFVFAEGAAQIIMDTQYPEYLATPTRYLVTTSSDNSKQLQAKVEVNGKQQWIQAGQLTGYSIQLLDKTSFEGTIAPNYNTVTFKSPTEEGNRSVLVGKLTGEGKNLIDSGDIKDIRVVRTQTPNYRLVVPSEQIDIKVSDLAPAITAVLGDGQSADLNLEQLKIFDNKFSATVTIAGETYYLSGVNASLNFEKKNRDNLIAPVRKERFEAISVELIRDPEPNSTIEVYSGATRIGEITQPAEQKFWNNRIDALEDATGFDLKVQSVTPKQVGFKVSINEDTLYNSNVWADVEPARTYQRLGKNEVQSPKLTHKELRAEEYQSETFKAVLAESSRNLRRQADLNSFPQSFSAKVRVPMVDENGFHEVEQLKLVVPDNKIKAIEAYFSDSKIDIKYTKLERGIPETYEESRRGYNVLRVNPDDLSPANKTAISKQLGKPVSQADYQAKLESVRVIRDYTPIKLNTLKQWIDRYPQSTNTPVLDLEKSKPVPYSLKPITGEVLTRFKGKATQIDNSIVFEFINDRQRDTAAYHLGLPIKAELPSEDGKSTRYFAVVESATLQTYLNDRAISSVLVKDGVTRTNPILASYGTNNDWTKLQSRARIDIIMGFSASKYIGVPLEANSRTSMYRDNWGANANSTTYESTDVVMISGNRTGKDTSNELLARHYRTQYLPLINAAVAGKAKILVGADAGIDRMVREHLIDLGYELQQNAAGIYEASIQWQVEVEQSIPLFLPKQEETEREEQEMEMGM